MTTEIDTAAEVSRTVTRHRVAVRAAAAACLMVVALVSGCATPVDEPAPTRTSAATSADVVAQPNSIPAQGGDSAEDVASPPERIEIDAIGVDSDVMDLGLLPDGAMDVPPGGFPAGWYTGSPIPGQLGPSIVAGHVDWAGSPGVFYRLRELQQGDDVSVTAEDGSTVRFVVSAVEQYPKDAFPTQKVYGDLDHPGLRLITCGGQFDSDVASYEDNIVVYADRV
ncbi:class F sortase [Rhodococcoides fascians]|uniref:class F sortase n=1 Tax=Rhodococcoides fascians TaxID=1828 RepID=UPI000AC47CBF|nr:class F sortase [Rhodococcus fascians]